MSLIDFILNVAGLLLWLNWRSAQFDPMAGARPSTLAGTLRRADKPGIERWLFLVALAGLLLLRAVFYWQIGPAANWTASLKLAAISVSFRSDFFGRMLLFSVLSFAVTLAAFLLWILFLSLLAGPGAEFDGVRKFARVHLGVVAGWPRWVKLLLPLLGVGFLWWLLSWPFVHWGILPRPVSAAHRVEQSLVIGLGSYLVWKYIVAGVLTLHLVNSYVYLGNHPFWIHVNSVARRMLTPLRGLPLCVGKVDFAPVVVIAGVFLFATVAEMGQKLPFGLKIWGLTDLYRWVSG